MSEIFSFWRQLIALAMQDSSFSQRTYFDVLGELSGNNALVHKLDKLVTEDHNDTDTLLQESFETLNAPVPCDTEQTAIN